jgi:diguanylate cyclase (GGDEF)-like protein
MSRCRWPIWLLLAALSAAPAGACGLQVELLYTADRLDGPPAAAPVLSRIETDAATGRTMPIALPRRTTGHWLRLSCRQGLDVRAGWQLVVDGARPLDALTFYPPGAPPRRIARAGTSAADDAGQPGRSGWSLVLPRGWPASSVAYLHAEGVGTGPMRLRLVRADELLRERRDALRRTRAAVAVLLAVALGMFAAHARIRDRVYLAYAGYLVCIALYVLLSGGDAASTGVSAPLLAHGLVGPWAVATLAAALHLAFAGRVLELGWRAPAAATLVRALVWLSLGLLATLLVGHAQVQAWYGTVGNALLVAGAPVVPGLALLAWRRGSPHAVHCLVGWTPLAAVAALAAAHRLGLVERPGAEAALPLAAAVEALVLAFALGRHATRRARLARRARRSPDRDALTGALNAHALERRLEAWRGSGPFDVRRCCLLLLDLDDFAELNARHGRAAGDAVLRQVQARLRTQLRSDDALARVDGDRFAIVSECAHDDGESFARRLGDALAATPFRFDRQSLVVTASIGMATARRGEPVALLTRRARQALQRARSLGNNAISTAEPPRRVPAIADL